MAIFFLVPNAVDRIHRVKRFHRPKFDAKKSKIIWIFSISVDSFDGTMERGGNPVCLKYPWTRVEDVGEKDAEI